MELSDESVLRRLFEDPLELQQWFSRRLPGPVTFIAIRTYVADPRDPSTTVFEENHCDLWLTRWSFEPDPAHWKREELPHCDDFHGLADGPGEQIEGIELGWLDYYPNRGFDLCTVSYLTDMAGILREAS